MNYFELFDLPIQLQIDKKKLPSKFFELSRKYHPDYFVKESSERQADSLEISAQLNRAYKVFRDDDETIKYVLQMKGLLEEEEKYVLPPDFLMEVLEINEQLMDSGDDPKLREKLIHAIEELNSLIYSPVKNIIENYKEGSTTTHDLLKVKEYYYKKKYLLRIKDQLKENS